MGLFGRFLAPRLPKIAISIFFAFKPQLYAIQGLVIDVLLASLQNSDSDLPHSCPGLPYAAFASVSCCVQRMLQLVLVCPSLDWWG